MDERDVRKFLAEVRSGKLGMEAAVERLRGLPYEDMGFAKIDHHRALRQGYPEVIFGRGKTPNKWLKLRGECCGRRRRITF